MRGGARDGSKVHHHTKHGKITMDKNKPKPKNKKGLEENSNFICKFPHILLKIFTIILIFSEKFCKYFKFLEVCFKSPKL